MIQWTALCTVRASEIDRMKAMHAVKNAATTTPASRRTRTSMPRPEAVATRKTRRIASSAPAKAASGSGQDAAPTPRDRTSTAPTEAPPEIPRM